MRNALSVDVEDWFQVGAFEQVIDRGAGAHFDPDVAHEFVAMMRT